MLSSFLVQYKYKKFIQILLNNIFVCVTTTLDNMDKREMNDVDYCGYIEHRSAMNARQDISFYLVITN